MTKTFAIVISSVFLLTGAEGVFAECVVLGYKKGSRIPVYIVRSKRDLTEEWEAYVESQPDTARLADFYRHTPLRGIHEQCLVEVSLKNKSIPPQSLIMQQPCSDFSIGDKVRVYVWNYCIEFSQHDPDFYSTLPYRHAYVTTDTRYWGTPKASR